MALVPERVWNLMTEEERAHLQMIAEGFRFEPRVACPQCGALLGVRLKVTAGAVVIDESGNVAKSTATEVAPAIQASSLEAKLIGDAQDSGMLAAFEQAVKVARSSGGIPTDIGAFFVSFLRGCVAKRVPRFVIDRYMRELLSDRLEFWSLEGVCAVIADGVIRAFVPLSLLLGQPMYGIGSNAKRMGAHPEKLDEWVRGRFGYVPAKSKAFMDEMRRKSLGDFCEFVQ